MKKIADIIRYIEDNLDTDLTMEAVARMCGYSRHHFQRLFAHCVGVNVGYYIDQRRLMKAAEALFASDARIIDIAQNAGYGSQEAFARAFKNLFHKTPTQYRKEKCLPVLRAFPFFDKDIVHHLGRYKELATPRYVHREHAAYIGFTACVERRQANKDVQNLWKEMERRSDEIHNKRGGQGREHVFYGLLREGGASPDGVAYNRFHYSAVIEVERGTCAPEGMDYIEIKPQHYAVFTHNGGMGNLLLTNQYIWGVWLPQSGQYIDDSADMEVYPVTFRPGIDEKMEIWVPLRDRSGVK